MNAALIAEVGSRAGGCCEYCLMPQAAHVLTFPIDHVIARQHGGETHESNLALILHAMDLAVIVPPLLTGIDP